MTLSASRHKPRRWPRRLFAAFLLFLLLLAVLFALACWPPAIVSQAISDEQLLSDALGFESQFETILDARLSDAPVQVSVSAEEVNAYCAALQRDDLWTRLPIQDDRLRDHWQPRGLSDLRIAFHADQAWIIGSLRADSASASPRTPGQIFPLVLSIRVRPSIAPDRSLNFDVVGLRIGHLPIPAFLARPWLPSLSDSSFSQGDSWSVKHIGIVGGRLYLWAGPSSSDNAPSSHP